MLKLAGNFNGKHFLLNELFYWVWFLKLKMSTILLTSANQLGEGGLLKMCVTSFEVVPLGCRISGLYVIFTKTSNKAQFNLNFPTKCNFGS